MKKVLFFAAAAMLFAACSNEEALAPQVEETNSAIAFDTYTSGTTRAGLTGVMSTSTLQTSGFGVFASHTTGSWTASATPNFMYNEEISYGSSVWSYAPLKYWPNNTGVDMQSNTGHATTTAAEYLSFFAYAPYVSNTDAATAAAADEPGIIGFSAADAAGAPYVSYLVATAPSESVDLLWGVAQAGNFSYTNVAGTTSSVTEGFALKDLLKPSIDQKIKFNFKHALSRLGLTIVSAVDQEDAGGVMDENETRIFVKSIAITDVSDNDAQKLAANGQLVLNNAAANTALWQSKDVSTPFSYTLDGTHELEASLCYVSDGGSGVNAASSFAKEGVKTYEKSVIADSKYFMFIPTEGDNMTELEVNIKYYVITYDDKLDGNYSVVPADVTKRVKIDFDNNKAYTLKLTLGMTSVKLDAEVASWEVGDIITADLPKNQD